MALTGISNPNQEFNPFNPAGSTPGKMYATGLSDINFDTLTPGSLFGTSWQTPKDPGMSFPTSGSTPGDVFGTGLPSGYNPVSGQSASGGSIWDSLQSILNGAGQGGGSSGGASAAGAQGGGNGFLNWLKNFATGQPGQGFLSGLGPYAAVAGIGMNQAKNAQEDAAKSAGELKALGQPYTDAGKQLLGQFQGGQLRPEQQQFVSLSNQFGDQLSEAATPLGKIAQQAFADYNSGKLGAADELKLQNQIAAQKQQVRQMMATSGITDSSVLAGQDQQIDNQAMIARQDVLDKRFATGNQAYDQWLRTTAEGQQLKLQGQQFASQSFEQMLNDALGLGAEGMQPAMEAIQLKMQSDADLSQTVSELLGNLASAYSYAMSGPGNASTTNVTGGGSASGGGGGGSAPSGLSQIISGISGVVGAVKGIGGLFGFEGAGGQAADLLGGFGKGVGYLNAAGNVYNAIDDWESGDTGGNAMRGLQAGASLGSVVPGLGTVVGGLVGGALGAISSVFGPGMESESHKVWDQYQKKIPPNTPGAQIPTEVFEEALLGAWQSEHNRKWLDSFTKLSGSSKHGGNAEGFKGWMVDKLADGIKSGTVTPGMSSQKIFDSYIGPQMDQYWKQSGSKMTIAQWKQGQASGHNNLPIIMTQLVDRVMSGQQIDRHSEDYRGKGSKYADVPSLQEALQGKFSIPTTPQPAMSG